MSSLDSLAARLGMRRSPSGTATTGTLVQPSVAARCTGERVIPAGRPPDPVVFGPQCEQDGVQHPLVHCRACEAGWSLYGGAVCWCCGKGGR